MQHELALMYQSEVTWDDKNKVSSLIPDSPSQVFVFQHWLSDPVQALMSCVFKDYNHSLVNFRANH